MRHALALAALFLLAACGRSETDRETESSRPGRQSRRHVAGQGGLSRVVADSVSSPSPPSPPTKAVPPKSAAISCWPAATPTDAAVAMYFAMAVTLPSAASLGRFGRLHCPQRQDQGGRSLRLSADRRARHGRRPALHRAVGGARHHADACPSRPAALGGDGGAGRTAGALRRAGIARPGARLAGQRRAAGRRSRGAAHFWRRWR